MCTGNIFAVFNCYFCSEHPQARTQGEFEVVRTNPLFWLGIRTIYVKNSRSTTGLVRRMTAGDPRLLAYNNYTPRYTHIARHRVWLGFGGLTLYVKGGGSGPGTAGFIDRRRPPAPAAHGSSSDRKWARCV